MAVGHAGRPDPATARRSVPSAWPGSWAGGADSSGPTRLGQSTVHIHLSVPSRDWTLGCTIGRSEWPSDMPAGRTQHCPSVCAVGMAGQLGWGCRLEWPNTTVHIHLSVPSRDWTLGCTIGRSGWPSDMPAGRTQHCPSVCAVGMAGQLGWGCRLGLEWLHTTVHIHLSVPSRDWTLGCTIGRFSKPHVPCACSPLSGPSQTYGALVHSSRGGRPTWSACSWPRLHRGLVACHPGRNLRVTR